VAVAALHGEILPLHDAVQPRVQLVQMAQVAHAQGLFHILVRVHRGDAPAGGAELLVAETVLLQPVQQLVVGHADGGPVADLQIGRAYGDAALPQAGSLVEKMLKVDDYAGAQDVHGVVPQDTGGQQVHDELALLVHHGVAGVVAALIADDHVVFLAQQVHHAALALVSPVGSDYCCKHFLVPLSVLLDHTFIPTFAPRSSLWASSTGRTTVSR